MIWLIAKKDFLLNLLSARFIIGFALCLVVIPFTIIVGIDDYRNQMRMYTIDQAQAEKDLQNVYVWSAVRPTVIKQPEMLGIFSKGITPNVGTRVQVQLQEYPLFPWGHTSSRDNPLLNAFFSLDFSTVIAIVISLLALVFAYDSITREREDGTMKLIFTGKVSRISFIAGKLLGLLITLLPILLFCYLLACLIILVNPGLSFTSSEWYGILLLLLTSVIYMVVFIALGMFVSSMTSRSSSSIVVCLLIWISFLFLIPNAATYVSQSIAKTPLYDNVQASINEQYREYQKAEGEKNKEIRKDMISNALSHWNYSSGNDGYIELSGGSWEMTQYHKRMVEWGEPERIATADKIWPLQKDYLDKLEHQGRIRKYLSWLSPSELFGQATDALSRTDAGAFLKYMESLRIYRERFISFFKDKNVFSSYRWFTAQPEEDFISDKEYEEMTEEDMWKAEKWSSSYYPKLNTDEVPRYVPVVSSPLDTFQTALGRLTALLGMAVLLLIGTIAAFMKYDVR